MSVSKNYMSSWASKTKEEKIIVDTRSERATALATLVLLQSAWNWKGVDPDTRNQGILVGNKLNACFPDNDYTGEQELGRRVNLVERSRYCFLVDMYEHENFIQYVLVNEVYPLRHPL